MTAPHYSPINTDLTTLRTFVAIAHERGFRRVARSLGVRQSTVSRQLQRLEGEFSAKLVVRAPQGVVLTQAGASLLTHVEQALALLESAKIEIGNLSEPKGTVKIGSLASVGAFVLPTIVTDFQKQYEDAQVFIHEGVADDLEDRVASGELDFAIVDSPVRRHDLTRSILWREDLLLALPPDHHLARKKQPISLPDVATEPYIYWRGRGRGVRHMEAACETRGVSLNIVSETEDIESLKRMVEAGVGVSIVPELITGDRSHWRAALMPIASDDAYREVVIVHRGASYLTSAARALRDTITTYAKQKSKVRR